MVAVSESHAAGEQDRRAVYLVSSIAGDGDGMTPNSAYKSIHGCASCGLSRVANRVRVTLAITAEESPGGLRRVWRRWRARSPPGLPTQPPPGSHFETALRDPVDVTPRDPDGGEAVARADRVEDRSDARGAALQRDRQDRLRHHGSVDASRC